MDFQRKLAHSLREVAEVEDDGAGSLRVWPRGGRTAPPARLRATNEDLETYLHSTAKDGLLALGDVGGDSSGVTAALGLLLVHIEEELYVDSEQCLREILIGPTGVTYIRA